MDPHSVDCFQRKHDQIQVKTTRYEHCLPNRSQIYEREILSIEGKCTEYLLKWVWPVLSSPYLPCTTNQVSILVPKINQPNRVIFRLVARMDSSDESSKGIKAILYLYLSQPKHLDSLQHWCSEMAVAPFTHFGHSRGLSRHCASANLGCLWYRFYDSWSYQQLTWVYELATNPYIQKKLQEETDKNLPGKVTKFILFFYWLLLFFFTID